MIVEESGIYLVHIKLIPRTCLLCTSPATTDTKKYDSIHMHLPWLAVQLSHYLQLDDAVYYVQPCEVPLLVLFRYIVIVVYMATY